MTQESTVQENTLAGYDVVLNPKTAGMYVDPVENFTLSFFPNGKDRIRVTKDMDTTFIMKNIKVGILRVFKGDKELSKKFGGNYTVPGMKPLVKIPLKAGKPEDARLIRVLDRNNQDDIIRDIFAIRDLATLERLDEIEREGKNPSSCSRGAVLETIKNQLKLAVGVGQVKESEEGKETISIK